MTLERFLREFCEEVSVEKLKVKNVSGKLDLAYILCGIFAGVPEVSLEKHLHPLTHGTDALKGKMSWLITNFLTLSPSPHFFSRILTAFVYELEENNLWQHAIYALQLAPIGMTNATTIAFYRIFLPY